jgi:mannitol/fructose-specific phosphotransferase system IIA component (Ntr-type)
MAIALADILDQGQVALQLRSRRRPNVIREVVSLFEKTGSVARPADFVAQVLSREEEGSTLSEMASHSHMHAPSWSIRLRS